MWDPYAHIWKVDKEEFLVKYRDEGHIANDFDSLIISYSELANTVQIQETTNQVGKKTIFSFSLLFHQELILVFCLYLDTFYYSEFK